MTMMMVSCGSDKKSDDDKEKEEEVSKEEQIVRDFEKKCDAYAAALEKGDEDAAAKIDGELQDLLENNFETIQNMNEEQQKRLEAAAMKLNEAVAKYNGIGSDDDMIFEDFEDEDDTTVESYEYEDADYGMSEEDAAALGF